MAGGSDSGELFRHLGGVIWTGSRGERNRRAGALYRAALGTGGWTGVGDRGGGNLGRNRSRDVEDDDVTDDVINFSFSFSVYFYRF